MQLSQEQSGRWRCSRSIELASGRVLRPHRRGRCSRQDDGADASVQPVLLKGDGRRGALGFWRADGTYKVMVSTREAGVQFGVRDQYVLPRIAKENRLRNRGDGDDHASRPVRSKGGSVVFWCSSSARRLRRFDPDLRDRPTRRDRTRNKSSARPNSLVLPLSTQTQKVSGNCKC